MISSIFRSLKIELQVQRAGPNLRHLNERALKAILKGACRSTYGRTLGVSDKWSLDTYRSRVPLTSYADYAPYIDAIVAGERDVLWPARPRSFVTTSGTTGIPKVIPITSHFLHDYHMDSRMTYHRMMLHHPSLLFGDILAIGGPVVESNIGGLPAGSITGLIYSTLPEPIRSRLILDNWIHDLPSIDEKLYLIARLSVAAPVVGVITVIPGALLLLDEFINDRREQLIEEVDRGLVSHMASVSQKATSELAARLKPNRARARLLRDIVLRHGRLLPKAMWPVKALCTYVKEIQDGQLRRIRDSYGDLTTVDPGLLASEGRVSIGLTSGQAGSAVIPSASLLEFVPWDLARETGLRDTERTVLPDELTVGSYYAPVISNRNGFLRYVIGDIIKVTGTLHGIPVIEYVGRVDNTISIAGEKMTEAQAREAVRRTESALGADFETWMLGTEWTDGWPRYVFVFVCNTEARVPHVAEVLEESLQGVNLSYARKREQRLILTLRAKVANAETVLRFGHRPSWFGQVKQKHLYDDEDVEFAGMLKATE